MHKPVSISDKLLYFLDDGTCNHYPIYVFYLYKCGGRRIQRAQSLFVFEEGGYVLTLSDARNVDMHSGYVNVATCEDLLFVFNNWKQTSFNHRIYSTEHAIFDIILKCSIPHKCIKNELVEAWKIFQVKEAERV